MLSLWDLPQAQAEEENIIQIKARTRRLENSYSYLAYSTAQMVLEYLERRGNLADYISELGKNRPHKFLYDNFSGEGLQEGLSALIAGKKVKFVGRAG